MVETQLNPTLQSTRTTRTRRFLIIGLALLFFIVLVCTGLSTYVGWSLTHKEKSLLTSTPASLGLTFKPISFKSRTNAFQLKGWFLPAASSNPKNVTIIIAHGYGKNRMQEDVPGLNVAQGLVQAGYHVLMFDFRASGESEGNLVSVGQYEQLDLLGAVDWVKANQPGKIGVLGYSMGGSTALLAAAEEPSISGVIADSPFNNLKIYLEENLPVWSHLPAFPFTPLILSILPPLTGLDPSKVDPLTAVDLIYPRPILFIHSVDDDTIPYTNSESMWQKHPDKFEFWRTSVAGHVGTYKQQSTAYIQKLVTFIDKW